MFCDPSLSNFCQKIISLNFFWNWVDLPPSYLDNVLKFTVFLSYPYRDAEFSIRRTLQGFPLPVTPAKPLARGSGYQQEGPVEPGWVFNTICRLSGKEEWDMITELESKEKSKGFASQPQLPPGWEQVWAVLCNLACLSIVSPNMGLPRFPIHETHAQRGKYGTECCDILS